MEKPTLRTPLSSVRGLGSAREGTHHFIMQRVTAIALVPLTWWFMAELLKLVLKPDGRKFMHWFASGFHVTALVLMLVALFWHAKLGIQTIIEDYVHCPCIKIAALLVNYFVMVVCIAVSIIAVLKLHFHAF